MKGDSHISGILRRAAALAMEGKSGEAASDARYPLRAIVLLSAADEIRRLRLKVGKAEADRSVRPFIDFTDVIEEARVALLGARGEVGDG
jgi:hypothetical protein